VFVSCVVLETAGAGVATLHGASANPTTNFTAPLGHVLGDAVLIGITVGAVAANVLNIYSGSMSFLTLGIELPLRLRRALVAMVSGALGLGIGLAFKAQVGPGSHYENFLLAITYWITPYLAVVLLDYWLRRGEYDEREFFDRRRPAGRRRWRWPRGSPRRSRSGTRATRSRSATSRSTTRRWATSASSSASRWPVSSTSCSTPPASGPG